MSSIPLQTHRQLRSPTAFETSSPSDNTTRLPPYPRLPRQPRAATPVTRSNFTSPSNPFWP